MPMLFGFTGLKIWIIGIPKIKQIVLDSANCKWSKPNIGLPSVIKVGKKLAIIYDGNTDRPVPAGSNGNMRRDVGLAWLTLPLKAPGKKIIIIKER